MKKLVLILLMGAVNSLKAQITYDFATSSPGSGVPSGWTASDVTVGNTTTLNSSLLSSSSPSSGYSGASGGNNGSISAKDGAFSKATSSYFQFTLTPSANNVVRLSGISFGVRSTASGPTSYALYSSLDNYSTSIVSGSLTPNSIWVLVSQSFSGVDGTAGAPVTLRVYGSGGSSASAGNWRLDDVYLALGSTLPVSLLSFNAQTDNFSVRLDWKTASEANSKEFEIMKSLDGSSFESIGVVADAGNSSSLKSYTFSDRSFAGGHAYYQLIQRDLDGKTRNSTIVSVYGEKSEMSLSPIIRSNNLVGFEIKSAIAQSVELHVFNDQGQTLVRKTVQVKQGMNDVAIGEIRSGKMVIARLSSHSGTVTKKYFIE